MSLWCQTSPLLSVITSTLFSPVTFCHCTLSSQTPTLATGRCQLYLWCAISLMSVSACRAHHVDTWPWNESIITPGKCFCLFIFSHLHYSVLCCSQVATVLRRMHSGTASLRLFIFLTHMYVDFQHSVCGTHCQGTSGESERTRGCQRMMSLSCG